MTLGTSTTTTTASSSSTFTLASFNRPTARAKIHARAQNIAAHLSNSSPPSSSPASTMASSSYTSRKIGSANTLEHRVFIEKDGVPVSPWHDIPLYANESQTVLNMIVEVPRWTNAKMEVSFVGCWRRHSPLNGMDLN